MGKNQNTWSQRTKIIFCEIKIIFHPLGSLAGKLSFFDRNTSEALGTCRRPLQWPQPKSWDNVPMDLKYVCQQYSTCMCFLGFIRYNKTFIACGFRKYLYLYSPSSIIFPSGDALREYDTLGWINFHISLTSM